MAPLVAESRYGVPTDFDLLEVGTNTILLMSYPYLREGIRHLDDVSKKTVYSERQLIKDGMFLFDNQHGSMKMKYGRSPKLMDGLCQVLGKVFFNDPEWYTDELSCDLDRLADRDLTDSIPPNSPFKAVTTTKLVFRSRRSGTWITLDSKKGVWTEYWRLCKVQPGDMVVRSGKLSLDWHQGGRAKTVEVNFPNRTSLNETENDRLAEQLLRDLGIVRSGPWGVEGENE
jgi:hypothetical protein